HPPPLPHQVIPHTTQRRRRTRAAADPSGTGPPRNRTRTKRLPGRPALHRRRPDRGVTPLPAGAPSRGTSAVRPAHLPRRLPRSAQTPTRVPVGRGDVPPASHQLTLARGLRTFAAGAR